MSFCPLETNQKLMLMIKHDFICELTKEKFNPAKNENHEKAN